MLLRSYFSFWDDEAESETGGSEEDAPVDETPTEETVSSEEETPIADDPPGEEMAAVADAPPTEETFTAEPVASIDPVEAAVAASGRITYSVDGQSQELGSSTLVQTADGRVALATVNHVLQTEGGVLRDSEGAPRELGDQSGLSVEIQGSKFDLPVEGTT